MVGYGDANAVMKSHSPAATIPSTRSIAIAVADGATFSIAPGENQAFIVWRYFTCSGGSRFVGMNV